MPRGSLVAAGTLVALATSGLTVGAQAESTPVASELHSRAAVEQMQGRALVAAGFSLQVVSAAQRAAGRRAISSFGTGALLLPAGDMNGDGVDEVLDTRYHDEGSRGERLVLFCRNGATGAVRWRKVLGPEPDHLYLPGPQLLGPKGLPGVVIVDLGTTTAGQSATVSLRLLALDDTGVKFWSHRESGTFNGTTGAEQGVPVPVGLDAFQNKAEDWLIARMDSPGGDNAATSLTPVRVRGTDGTVDHVGAKVTSPTGVPSMVDVPDLSGDKLNDVVLVVPGSGDGTGVFARHGSDGTLIWTNTSLTLNPFAFATPVGDVHASADGSPVVDDVAVNTGSPSGGGLGLPLPFPDPTAPGDHGQVALLDGANGSQVWANDGDYAYPVVQAGNPLKSAVGVVTTDFTSDDTTTTATTTLATFDDANKQIYSQTWQASTKTDSSGESSAFSLLVSIGDFDGDKSTDGFVLIDVSSGDNIASYQAFFFGADGSRVKSGHADPLGGSTTGHGDDLVLVKTHHGLVVSVHTGADNSELFSTKVKHTRGVQLGTALGVPLHDTSSCADVLVAADGRRHGAVGVLTAKGKLEWVVRYDPRAKAAGTVFHPATAPRIPTCGG
jgi:hypothetical protein